MTKILTISVAAYNVDQYLDQCLASCAGEAVVDRLEVLIVNDGSTDNTASIAENYAREYPQTFRLINQPNGGYGTTVNRSMGIATGKYFRLLDGDDWLDAEGLRDLLDVLEETDADWVVSPMYRMLGGDKAVLNGIGWNLPTGITMRVADVNPRFYTGMWKVCVATRLLRQHPFELPAHCLYTDQLFVVNTLMHACTFRFSSKPVYCYRLCRDGQSCTPAMRLQHIGDVKLVTGMELMLFEQASCEHSESLPLLATRIAHHYVCLVKVLLMQPRTRASLDELRALERDAKLCCPEVYEVAARDHAWLRVIRACNHRGYWLTRFIDASNPRYWK